MKRADPTLLSPFHMEWLVPMDATTGDDYTRAVAEKADVILRSARFMATQHLDGAHDIEVRVWVEAAVANACVSITWEPGVQRFGFHLLDGSLRERLGCVVFDAVPCIDASQSEAQSAAIMDAMLRAMADQKKRSVAEIADAVRDADRTRRVPVKDAKTDE